MPNFVVTVDGKKYAVVADSEPTPDEVRAQLGPQAPSLGFNAPPKLPARDEDTPTFLSDVFKSPGIGESVATLPLALADLLPVGRLAKPFTIPLAALLGGLGEGAEQLVTDKPFSISDIVGAGVRQGGLEGTGRLIEASARPLMAMALPGASKNAVTAALTEGVGRNLDKARGVSREIGQQVADRVAPMQIPLDEALQQTRGAIGKAVNESPRPMDTYQALTGELGAIQGQNAPILSGAEALAKKRGAAQGFDATARKELMGREVTPPSVIEEAFRKGLQAAMEARDVPQGLGGETLHDLNGRLGRVTDLIKYLDPEQKKELLARSMMLAGRMTTGGLLGTGVDAAAGTEGHPGAIGGALLAANPGLASVAARIVRRGGEALPPLVRGTTVTIDSIRRRNQTEP